MKVRLTCAVAASLLLLVSTTEAQVIKKPVKTKISYKPMTPVTGYLTIGESQREVTLVGRSADKVVFTMGSKSVGERKESGVGLVDNAYFNLKFDRVKHSKAVRARDWNKAVAVLFPCVRPILPYLDLEGNNAAEAAMTVGDYMMKAAEVKLRSAKKKEDVELARKQYEAAQAVYLKVTKADWYSGGTIAAIKRIRCMLARSKPKTARFYFDKIVEPMPGDAAYGLFYLVKAELAVNKGDHRLGMDSAVKSLCFDNKNIETFPDALLTSARCYEELQEWYRARDVYYEIAKIFPSTDWHEVAVRRLKFIMAKEFTQEEEKSEIESVFFGLKEDMNAKIKEYLVSLEEGKKRSKVMKDEEEKDADLDAEGDVDLDKD